MKRYIDADYTIKALSIFGDKKNGNQHFLNGIETAKEVINNQTTADVRENVRGEWEHWGSPFSDESEVIDTIVCSVCGARFIEPKDETKGEYNYCPNCGADMRGEA